jgi:hypothetical protein
MDPADWVCFADPAPANADLRISIVAEIGFVLQNR